MRWPAHRRYFTPVRIGLLATRGDGGFANLHEVGLKNATNGSRRYLRAGRRKLERLPPLEKGENGGVMARAATFEGERKRMAAWTPTLGGRYED